PILRGRNFTFDESRSAAPVAIISQAAAQRLWPNQEAVGRTLELVPGRTTGSPRYQTVTVVGVVRDEISRWIGNGEDPSLIYFPTSFHAAGTGLFVAPRGDAEAVLRALETD